MKMIKLKSRLILNSAGDKTIEVELIGDNGKRVIASVPSGISTGKYEKPNVAAEKACQEIEQIIYPKVSTTDFTQDKLDKTLEHLNCGANSTLAVSIAFSKANNSLTISADIKMPKMMVLLFEGGKHGNNNIKIQEFMTIVNSIDDGVQIYKKIKEELLKRNLSICVGAEGGFSPPGISDEEVLKIIAQYTNKIALDIANAHAKLSTSEIENFLNHYPIVSIEDPIDEENWSEWENFGKKWSSKLLIAADDLTVTNPKLIEKGADLGAFNAVIIKPNQQGTVTAALKAVEMAQKHSLKVIVSHRGAETNEDFIADFALAVAADFVKFGAPCRGERAAKYNRLLGARATN